MNSEKYRSEIEPLMKRWRSLDGLVALPVEYVIYHRELAMKELDNLRERGITVGEVTFEHDGWMQDEMKVVHASIVMPSGNFYKLIWHDSHDTGCFFVKSPNSGGTRMDLALKAEDKKGLTE